MGPAKPLRVAIYQYKARDEAPAERLRRLDEALAGLDGEAVDLIVCPELFLSGYGDEERTAAHAEPMDGPFSEAAGLIARRHRTAILYGYPEAAGGDRFNAAVCLGKTGEPLANHRKLVFPNRYEKNCFSPGAALKTFEIDGYRIGMLICCEIEFPEAARTLAGAGCHIVVAHTALTAEWTFVARNIVPVRAFENGVFFLYANYAGAEGDTAYLGESVIVAPDGRELARAGRDETVIAATLDPRRIAAARARLPYLADAAGTKFAVGGSVADAGSGGSA